MTSEERGLRTRIENDFTYHPPTEGQPQKYEQIRAKAKEFAEMLVDECPMGRELSTALTNLDQVVFWANASIARNRG